ncbi:M20/M25/M40 family metallo-hydrolase [Pyxidicoccus fallax]|uniref:M20/M25/M40 family metallo-hydrolase n=1 Tax=Pyxidicoccus fallax TaxID=394095 RepID=A0A848LGC0_9BACT|nr:M20/M25/M40 family metallo-hydrolase [Pyxidicoccus fallax]NMO16275.1 M20/M25/M40 family metallo-hydrolase [Pyxidicoccus fallax]NPC85084.1 M20/M25/M40 family metallo-hydrolase [Pyxidicoccus fallax]
MNVKRLASVVMVLGCVSAFAKSSGSPAPEAKAPADREVWITVGSDAAHIVSATLVGSGLAAPAKLGQKGEVTAFRVRESELNLISRAMHDQVNRCSGFMAHDSEASALAALDTTTATKAMRSLAVDYTVDNATAVYALSGGLQEANIRDTITRLSTEFTTRYHTSSTGTAAANWIRSRWEGLVPADRLKSTTNPAGDITVELFTHTPTRTTQPSVIMTIQGTTLASEIVVIGGHLDSTSSGSTAPGADDDASGIATITEVIRMAMVQGYRPQRTVKFMGYAAEEVGLRGSQEIANKYKTDGLNVVGVMQLDMTNYKSASAPADVAMITDNTNAAQNGFITSLISTYFNGQITWSNSSCGYACSDHASWTNAGFPASIPFETPMGQHNSAIHTVNDTLSRSGNNANHALKFAKIAAAYLAELAKGTVTVTDTTPPAVSLTAPTSGGTVSGTVTVTASASDASGISRVEFLVDGQVVTTVVAAPYSFSWDTAALANGSHTVAAKAYDGVNNSATSSAVTVTVSNSTGTAGFDSTLQAPRCASASSSCDSGLLLNGRGGVGPEINTPNTLRDSCLDGVSGAYHSDESNDRIKVSTVDGTPFAPGKTVRVEATVWAYSTTADKLDLYYTGDATAATPTWTYITTLSPPAKGAQTLSATYTLPAGAVQAVRARFRYNGSPAACGTGSYNDHDDLVFAAQ